jgi:hypothetical protein
LFAQYDFQHGHKPLTDFGDWLADSRQSHAATDNSYYVLQIVYYAPFA